MRTAAVLIASCAFTTLAMSQEGAAPAAAASPKVESTVDAGEKPAEGRKAQAAFLLYGENTFSSDLSDGPGEVSVWRAGASLDMSFPVGERSGVGTSLRAERWGFDFSDATAFDSADGQPWDDVTDLALLVSLRHQFNDRWSGAVGLGVESAFADGADFNDSLTGGGFLSASYKFSDAFTGGLGLTVRSRLEDDVLVIPFLLLDWKIADKWSLTTSPGVSRRLLGLAYAPNDQWTITFGGGYEALDFRLDDTGPAPKGVARYDRIPVGLDVTWNISKQLGISIYGGAQVWQQYQLDDENGDEIAEDDADIAPFVGATVEWRF